MAAEARRRLAANYKAKIARALQPITSQDARAVRAALEGFTSAAALIGWMEGYFGSRQSPTRRAVERVFQSLATETAKMAGKEIDLDVDESRPVNFAAGFSRKFAEIYTGSSTRQLSAVATEAGRTGIDPVEAIDTRLTEWVEGGGGATRAVKAARRQSVTLSNVIAKLVFFSGGYSLVWATFGKNCPYCDSLNGKRVSSGEPFAPDGNYNPAGAARPIRLRRPAFEPPIHGGCDCNLNPG